MLGTLIEKTTYDLGLATAANLATSGVPIEVQEYYLRHKELIPEAIRRGFILPQPEVQLAPAIIIPELVIDPPVMYKTAETDLNYWLNRCQEFAEKFFGVKVNLREMFMIPEEIPWASAIPVFDPGNLTNRDAVEKALKAQKFVVWEEADVMNYSGSIANAGPTLHFIQNSIEPDSDTLNQTPDQLVEAGKNLPAQAGWLSQRGYALAFGLHYFVTKKYLDRKTWTWFPVNRLASGEVTCGYWDPGDRRVKLGWDFPGYHDPNMGARRVMSVSLRP